MLDKEKLLKEQRVAVAIDKRYMGVEGKFGVILKYLGKPVITQNSTNYEITAWQDVYEIEEEDSLPEEDPDIVIQEIGKVFDGLKFGHHIEITYMKEGQIPVKINEYQTIWEPASRILNVYYKGYLVYLEADGDLHIFQPMSAWEDIIIKLYESARKIQIESNKDSIAVVQKEVVQEKMTFLKKLREKWGI